MKIFGKITAIILAAFIAFSCSNHFNEADFVTTISTACLIKGGEVIMEYNDNMHQIAWRESDLQFRLMDDSVNDYFVVTMSTMPTVMGEQLQAEVTYTTNNDVKTVSGTFNASKISSTSAGTTIWLWNESADLAVVIQILR